MIGKIMKGCSFGGLVNYCNNIISKSTTIILAKGVVTTSNVAMAACFRVQAQMHPELKECVGHTALSFSPKDRDRMTDEFMAKIAEEYMQRMGYDNTQYVVYRHNDKEHDHMHIAYNIIDNNGKPLNLKFDRNRNKRVCAYLNKKYHLTQGTGKEKVNRDRLKGKDKLKYSLYDRITIALPFCKTWNDLVKRLADAGISVSFAERPDGKGRGVVFTSDNVSFSGSKIDKSLSYGRIEKVFAANMQAEIDSEAQSMQSVVEHWDKDSKKELAGRTDDNLPSVSSASEVDSTDAASGEPADNDSLFETPDMSGLAGAAAEMILQPHVVPSSGGGGGGSSDDMKKRKDDEDKYYKPRRRR